MVDANEPDPYSMVKRKNFQEDFRMWMQFALVTSENVELCVDVDVKWGFFLLVELIKIEYNGARVVL